MRKSCTKNVDEIEPWFQIFQNEAEQRIKLLLFIFSL